MRYRINWINCHIFQSSIHTETDSLRCMKRTNRNLRAMCVEYKLYTCIASMPVNLRSMEQKQCTQSKQHVVCRAFNAWNNLWNNIVKSHRFRKTSLSTRYLKQWIIGCAAKQICSIGF
eukprot:884879_1